MIWARSRPEAAATMSAALGPSSPMRMSSGPSSRNEKPRSGAVELHRRDAEIETRRRPPRPGPPAAASRSEKRTLHEGEPAARGVDQIGAERDRRVVAVDAENLRGVVRGKDRTRIAAGPEGAVDIDAAAGGWRGIRPLAGRARECDGPVRQRRPVARCRGPSSFPCSVARRPAFANRDAWSVRAPSPWPFLDARGSVPVPKSEIVGRDRQRSPRRRSRHGSSACPSRPPGPRCRSSASRSVHRARPAVPPAVPNTARTARSVPRSPPAAHGLRHRSRAGRGSDSSTTLRIRRGTAPSETPPGSTPAPSHRAATWSSRRTGP